ncbi:esterase CarE type B-like protein, partial [Leptotrombidium deliense]
MHRFQASPEVKVKLGTIRGNEINVEGKVVHEFAGIPYARPPIGESRFSKPLPIVESWSSVLVAQNFSKSCVQFIK